MGIHGLLKHLGSGKRTSLATFSAQHYVQHQRPLRLAIDISIWLFQIQAGQGGSNPALRTFYYRLLRLISLNIHPLFVFDGPNKPLFKRNKRVGGPGVRVASVPEFLAKQLLKQFGFPMHIAPGEAEAECALLQRQGVVDAVLSEDVDTMMFGSRLTLRNWTAEGSSKTPTHVNVYSEADISASSGLDSQGMVLVALMSGGDYIPEGIPGCGPKFAVDAAKAGFGRRLCSMTEKDTQRLAEWREELQMEFRTNASKYFSRRNTTLIVPDDFPNFEVLGNYINPCVSSLEKVEQLRQSLRWDAPLDLPALRSFAGDAFDWHDRGGAIKFIRNLSQSLLPRQLRLSAEQGEAASDFEQTARESAMLEGVHSTRTHATTDKAVEMRVSYIPAKVVPIDLSLEAIGDDQNQGADPGQAIDAEEDVEALDEDEDVPQTPSRRKRTFRTYEEGQAEKAWILREWVQLGCPSMLEDYEASLRVPREPARSTRNRVAKAPARTSKRGAPTSANSGMPTNALMRHVRTSKVINMPEEEREPVLDAGTVNKLTLPKFRRPLAQLSEEETVPATSNTKQKTASTKDTAPSEQPRFRQPPGMQAPRTPRKRRTVEISTPQTGRSAITNFFSPARRVQESSNVISLLSSSPVAPVETRQPTHTQRTTNTTQTSDRPASNMLQDLQPNVASIVPNPAAKRRQPRGALQKSLSMPVSQPAVMLQTFTHDSVECLDLADTPLRAGPDNSIAALPVSTTSIHAPLFTRTNIEHVRASAKSFSLPVATIDLSSMAPSCPSTLPTKHTASKIVAAPSTCAQDRQKKGSIIKIRESLDGAWTMMTADTLDLTGLDASSIPDTTSQSKKKARTWRASGVDILDLTGE